MASKSVLDPPLAQVLSSLRVAISREINAVKIGSIVAFNGAKWTSSVRVAFKKVAGDGSAIEHPVLQDVPTFFFAGGGAEFYVPVGPGDECILLFADRNIGAWFKSGGQAAPPSARSHDIADAIALVGLKSLAKGGTAIPTDRAGFRYGGANVEVTAAGLIAIKNATLSLGLMLGNLITILSAANTTGGGPFDSTTLTALTAFRLQIAELLL